jgi:cytoskeletal protein RodZ
MSKKRLLIIVLTIITILLILIAAYWATGIIPNGTDENPSSDNSPQETSPESLVESPETLQDSPNPSRSPTSGDPQNEVPPGTTFVVPESPLGTIGIITATVTALGIFTIKQRKKASQ